MGSKNRIAEWVVDILPASDTLYDLFAGGCSVTHCAMLSGKWNNYVINDINPGITQLFLDAMDGKYKDEKRWISREDFFKLKDKDPFVACCWSFGNDQRTYMYGPKIEPYKKACHYAIVFDDWGQYAELCPETVDVVKEALNGLTDTRERRRAFGPTVVKKIKELNDPSLFDNPLYDSVKRKVQFQNILSNERINSLSSTIRPTRLCMDYREVEIEPNSTVYCDIPYIEKEKYAGGFDHEAFYEWALSRPFDVYISEYSMPEGFTCIGEKKRHMTLASTTSYNTIEKIFINR